MRRLRFLGILHRVCDLRGMELFSLKGQKALVCGASQGIGLAIAEAFAAAGAEVVLLARSEDKLKRVAQRLPGKNHKYIVCDVQNAQSLERAVEQLRQEGISIWVNNTGGPKGGPAAEAGPEEFVQAFHQHLVSAQQILQAVLPSMRSKKSGRIINIISTSVKAPIANLGVSNTVRGAVAQWAKTLANELGPQGITVNNVLPGFTETERLEELKKGSAQRLSKTTEDVEKMWLGQIPLGRLGKPEEVASAVLFLASPAGAYVSGINLPVDGGRTPSL